MNLLIFGGTRFIGKHLVRKLLADGHAVTIATRGLTGDGYGDKVHRICVDRADERQIQKAFSNLHFDTVYDSLKQNEQEKAR